jgi:hypothetical protein
MGGYSPRGDRDIAKNGEPWHPILLFIAFFGLVQTGGLHPKGGTHPVGGAARGILGTLAAVRTGKLIARLVAAMDTEPRLRGYEIAAFGAFFE